MCLTRLISLYELYLAHRVCVIYTVNLGLSMIFIRVESRIQQSANTVYLGQVQKTVTKCLCFD